VWPCPPLLRRAIRDGEGYWFSKIVDGEVFFVSPPEAAKQYDNAAKALTERDALAQMCGDDAMTVRQIASHENHASSCAAALKRSNSCGIKNRENPHFPKPGQRLARLQSLELFPNAIPRKTQENRRLLARTRGGGE
jgi:hypothetical protein